MSGTIRSTTQHHILRLLVQQYEKTCPVGIIGVKRCYIKGHGSEIVKKGNMSSLRQNLRVLFKQVYSEFLLLLTWEH
jgi:hypothetical protein